jgi:hypothetical protein
MLALVRQDLPRHSTTIGIWLICATAFAAINIQLLEWSATF